MGHPAQDYEKSAGIRRNAGRSTSVARATFGRDDNLDGRDDNFKCRDDNFKCRDDKLKRVSGMSREPLHLAQHFSIKVPLGGIS